MAASKTKRWARVSSMPNCSIAQYAWYSPACPTGSSIACSKADKGIRHRRMYTLARQRNAFPLVEGQQDGNAKSP